MYSFNAKNREHIVIVIITLNDYAITVKTCKIVNLFYNATLLHQFW